MKRKKRVEQTLDPYEGPDSRSRLAHAVLVQLVGQRLVRGVEPQLVLVAAPDGRRVSLAGGTEPQGDLVGLVADCAHGALDEKGVKSQLLAVMIFFSTEYLT